MTSQEQQRRFTEWAEAYDNILWKVARSFAVGADQDDLHQEMLLALWQSVPAFRGDAKSSTFVYRVAYNYALGWIRKRRWKEVPIEYASQVAVVQQSENSPEAQVEMLYYLIRTLPELDRAIVLLYLDEVSYREISEVLGIGESNVGVRLNRLKKQLAERSGEVARA